MKNVNELKIKKPRMVKKMKHIIYTSIILAAIPLQWASAGELYKESLYIAQYEVDNATRRAELAAEKDTEKQTSSLLRPAAIDDLESTQQLYYFIDDIRYPAQLLSEQFDSVTGQSEYKAKSARAAQVHWLDLLNVVKSRLAVERSDAKKKFTLQVEITRTSVRYKWTLKFYDYAYGMRKFDDIPHHQAEMRRTIKYAERERDRAELIHKRAIYALANISNEEIKKRLDKAIADAKAHMQTIIDAHNKFNASNKVVEELLPDAWETEWPTFNYIMPCAEKDTSITAIVVQGTNQMDFAVDEDGTLVYPEGVSIAFDDMIARCAVIAVPKSGTGASVNWSGHVSHYREWWMSEKTPRTDYDEILATIDLVNLAFDSLPEAHIYLVYGNDGGALAKKVMDRLREDPNENIFKTYGHITVDTETGEYIGHNLDGSAWLSRDLDPIQKNK